MCGIFGYVGARDAAPLLLDALKRLEYRGYDSAGIALVQDGRIEIRKEAGKLVGLARCIADAPLRGAPGIGHTRWATHGAPTAVNAHPHAGGGGRVAVVQNGIVENHAELKQELQRHGARFVSCTDTETIAHLLARHLADGLDFVSAARATCKRLRGANVVVLLALDEPGKLVAARIGNAGGLVLGLGEGENFIASDASALLPHTRRAQFVASGQMAVVTADATRVMTLDGTAIEPHIETLDGSGDGGDKAGHAHFMRKEMHEQPQVLRATVDGRIDVDAGRVVLPDLNLASQQGKRIARIVMTGCGSALHAGMVGKLMIERLARIPVDVVCASELRDAEPVLDECTAVVALSQSGETVDTLGAMEVARQSGAIVWSIVNAPLSQAIRIADGHIAMRCGPEFGVASTKAFMAPLVDLYLLAVLLGGLRGTLSRTQRQALLRELAMLPDLAERTLAREQQAVDLAHALLDARNCLYVGRGPGLPLALEGALKLKELAYVHAEACAGGELKHGPIALVEHGLPIVCIALRDPWRDKMLLQMQQLHARHGRIIAVASDGDDEVAAHASHVLRVPEVSPLLSPVIAVLPLQQLAYHSALLRGHDVDQPRNLAKSVTVE